MVGIIQMRSYEDREGVKRTAVDIVAQDVEFLTQRARDDDGQYDEPTPRRRGSKPQLEAFDDDGDVPF